MQQSPDFYNQEYNPRLSIPNAAELIAAWSTQSHKIRTTLPGLLDLKYGNADEESVDLFWCLQPKRPLFIFLHGGYWRSLHKNDFAWIAPAFLKAGINVAVVNYDLVPQVPLEKLVMQVARSIAWLYQHAEELDFDSRQMYVGGHSAGGHLTAMMLCTLWPQLDAKLPKNLLKGGVAISGLFDLEPLCKASFLNVDLRLDETRALRMSPAYLVPSHPAPLLLAVGGLESSEFHRQSELLRGLWQSRTSVHQVNADGLHHLNVCDALADENHALHQATVALVSSKQ